MLEEVYMLECVDSVPTKKITKVGYFFSLSFS